MTGEVEGAVAEGPEGGPPHPAAAPPALPQDTGGWGREILALEKAGPEGRAALAWGELAHEGQVPPELCDDGTPWTTWLFLGGRGAGKTRAGAEWVAATAQALGAGGRIALVGATMADARAVMVEGPSGLLNLPFREGMRFEPSLRRVIFPGGAVGMLFSAEEPERLRGPQFHVAWGDELCAWSRGAETLAMLRLGLRLQNPFTPSGSPSPLRGEETGASRAQAARFREPSGSPPRLVLTSTPKPTRLLRGLLAEAGLARTDAPTRANAGNLAPGFLATMQALYGGTRRAAQELEGRVLDVEGALFTAEMIAGARRAGEESGLSPSPCGGGSSRSEGVGRATHSEAGRPESGCGAAPTRPALRSGHPPPEGEGERGVRFSRIVVAVDPPAGTLSGRARDACGVVVVGRIGFGREARAVVLADRTVAGLSPEGWAARVRATAQIWGADRVVVETNQGGAMAEAVLKASGLTTPVRRVHASLGKAARAEPVAALYEQGRVAHVAGLEALEEELMGLGAEGGDAGGSPDRADALVWAVSDLMLDGAGAGPRLRML